MACTRPAPSNAAAIARIPEPVPTSKTDAPSRSSSCSAARHSLVVAWWPVPKPIDGRMTTVKGLGIRDRIRNDGDPADGDRLEVLLGSRGPVLIGNVDRRARRVARGERREGGVAERGRREIHARAIVVFFDGRRLKIVERG